MWQVVSDKGISDKNRNEIKSVLAQALAENGQWFDALDIYKQIKSALEPKAVISLIVSTLTQWFIFCLVNTNDFLLLIT